MNNLTINHFNNTQHQKKRWRWKNNFIALQFQLELKGDGSNGYECDRKFKRQFNK
jgi:hypothetical protein